MTKKTTPGTDRQQMDEFAARLRMVREARGFTQRGFARDVLKVTPQRYGMWETGNAMPQTVGLMRSLCDALGVDANFLLFGETSGLKPEVYDLIFKPRK